MFTRIRKPITTLVLTAGAALFFTAAQAQTARFVSSTGSNANNCTRNAPCRTLQRGIAMTPAGGELQILDSGVYGNAVTIGKSITISAVGVSATVGSITIDAPGATVVLRGLLLNGTSAPGLSSGLAIEEAAVVHIVNCEIERFPGSGIVITAFLAQVLVSQTTARSNGLHGLLLFRPSGGTTRLLIVNSRFERNGSSGIHINGPSQQVMVEHSVSSHNGTRGLFIATNGGGVRISNSVFTFNKIGLENSNGNLLSRGNNTVSSNLTDTVGSIGALTAK